MDASTAEKVVSALDAELARRRQKRDAEEEQRWRDESDNDPVYYGRRYLDRLLGRIGAESPEEAAVIVMASAGDDADRATLERVEEFVEQIRGIAEMVERLEAHRADVEAGIVRKAGNPMLRVKSMAKLLADTKPRPDPAVPKVERSGRRRSEAEPAMSGLPISEDGVWQKGMVLSFNPRTLEGAVRASDGKEYSLAAGCLMKSGLVTLVPGMRAELRLMGGECDWIKAVWH
jgi:hypothetical protein